MYSSLIKAIEGIMPEKFIDKIKKVGITVDKFIDKLPDDEKVVEKVEGIFTFFGKKMKKIDRKLDSKFDEFSRKFRDDSSPENLSKAFDDFKNGTKDFAKDVKKSDLYKKLTDFLESVVKLITSIGKPKELSKAWDNFTKSAKDLGEAISKSLDSGKER